MDIQRDGLNPIYKFHQFQDFIDFCSNPANRNPNSDKESDSNNKEFHGTKDYAEAIKLVTTGWREGLDKASGKLVEAQYKVNNEVSPRLFYDVAGAYPNVPMAVAGDPCSMVNFGDVSAQARPVVRLLVNVGASGMYSVNEVMNRGLAVLAHAARLIEGGRSVGIDLVRYSTGSPRRIDENPDSPIPPMPKGKSGTSVEEVYVTVKRPDEDMDLDRLAFVLGHPATLRRLFFFMAECHTHIMQYGYGMPTDLPQDQIPSDVIYFPSLLGNDKMKRAYGGNLKDFDSVLKAVGKLVDDNLKGLSSEQLVSTEEAEALERR